MSRLYGTKHINKSFETNKTPKQNILSNQVLILLIVSTQISINGKKENQRRHPAVM